jgi:hypothetical protein
MFSFREYAALREGIAGQLYNPDDVQKGPDGLMTTTFYGGKKQYVLPDEQVQAFMQGTDAKGFEQRVKDYFHQKHEVHVKITWGPMGKWAILDAGEGVGPSRPDPVSVRQEPGTSPAKAMYNRVHPAQTSPMGGNN